MHACHCSGSHALPEWPRSRGPTPSEASLGDDLHGFEVRASLAPEPETRSLIWPCPTGKNPYVLRSRSSPSTSAPTGLTHIKAQSALIAPSLTWASWNLALMASDRIRKCLADCVGANLQDYEEAARTFSCMQARAMLTGLPRGGLNIAHEAVDRHVGEARLAVDRT